MQPPRRALTMKLLSAGLLLGAPVAAQQMSGAYPESYFRAPEPSVLRAFMMQQKEMDAEAPKRLPALAASDCVAGDANGYPCRNVDLLAFLPLSDIGGGNGNDIWGWTDPLTDVEYAIMGRTNGTAFVDLSDPENPIYLGNLATHTEVSTWRDIKVHNNHAFIVSEANDHGMQVFDLTTLRAATGPPVQFTETAHYDDFGHAHNIVINEDSGFAYAVGTGTCAGGLHIVDIQVPTAPTFAGCYASDGYTHDAQCLIYGGPDATYAGREICLAFNEDTLTVVDITDKSAPIEISRTGYVDRGYTHQGWITDDHRWVIMNDELDESQVGFGTRSLVWNLTDLDAPVHAFSHDHNIPAIDHNLYVKGNYVYESNYRAGLRILGLTCLEEGSLTEVGYFDTYPSSNSASFSGNWSNYPYFDSGIVIVSGIGEGLFVLRPHLSALSPAPTGFSAVDLGTNQVDLEWDDVAGAASYIVRRSDSGCAGPFIELDTTLSSLYSDTTVSGGSTYGYIIEALDPPGCESECREVSATGDCTLAPSFLGAGAAVNTFAANCQLEVRWHAATGNCSSNLVYNIYRDTSPGFTPSELNRVASCLTGSSWVDTRVGGTDRYYYIVRAEDSQAVGPGVCGGVEDSNAVEVAAMAVSDSTLDILLDGAEAGPVVTLEAPWLVSSADALGGAFSFRIAGNDPNMCAGIVTPTVVVTPSSVLSYGHREQNIETTWDGGTVEISVDGGATWSRLGPTPSYPHTFDTRSVSCNNSPSGGEHYSGGSGGFQSATVDLGPWSGQEVAVRFQFATDGRVDSTAWWIDEISVSDIAIGVCEIAPWQLYRSTVPSLAPGWQAAVPLPLLATSSIDASWPHAVVPPASEDDLDARLDPEPLMLYRLLDETGSPVPNQLLLVESATSAITISF